MHKKTKISVLLATILTIGMVLSGTSVNFTPNLAMGSPQIDPELSKFKNNFDDNGLVYIGDDDSFSTNSVFDYGDQQIAMKLSKLKPQDVNQLSDKFTNIAVDLNTLSNGDVLKKIKEKYNLGSRIIFKKDNIKIDEVAQILDSDTLRDAKLENDALTTVAISVFKDLNGINHLAYLNVEENNPDEVARLLAISCSDDKDTLLFSKKFNDQIALIQFGTPAYAGLGTSWSNVCTPVSSYDQWLTVNVNFSTALYKDPNNPAGGTYISMSDAAITVTPKSGYEQGHSFIYQNSNSSGTVQFYAPTPITNQTSFSVGGNFGYSPYINFGVNFNHATTITVSGSAGCNYTQWDFMPVIGSYFAPTSTQTYYEAVNQYYQPGSYFSTSLRYTVQMHRYDLLYATATNSFTLAGSN